MLENAVVILLFVKYDFPQEGYVAVTGEADASPVEKDHVVVLDAKCGLTKETARLVADALNGQSPRWKAAANFTYK